VEFLFPLQAEATGRREFVSAICYLRSTVNVTAPRSTSRRHVSHSFEGKVAIWSWVCGCRSSSVGFRQRRRAAVGGRSFPAWPKKASRPGVLFETCNSSLSALRCPRHSRTSRQQRRQARGHRDVVTQCGFASHMVASRPASQVHDISARRKSKVEHLLI
jgi:hypothetical protein